MGCNHSFKKPNNLKEIYNAWDVFIDWSLNKGNSHIAFTINIPNNLENLLDLINYSNILKMHPIDINSKKYQDYNCKKNGLFMELSLFWGYFDEISKFNKLITWRYRSTEENKNGVLHLHGIIAYRNLTDFNKNIKNNILNKLKERFIDCDIVLKDLNKFQDIKNWIKYLHKDKILVFPPRLDILEKYIHSGILNIFKKPYRDNYNLKNNFKLRNSEQENDYLHLQILDCFSKQPEKILNLNGIILNKNEINENTIIDLILNYLILNNYYVHNDNVYCKIENTLISYKRLDTIKEFIFNKFEDNIILYFTQNFPCQFTGFDFYHLIKTFKNKMEINILKIKNITSNKIDLNFSFLEFNDGVYDIIKNKFTPKDYFNTLNVATIKYYNKTYNRTRQDKPKNWINGIKNALGKDNVNDFITICLFIASLFKGKNDNIKKNFLYIHGKTNTGKSTYLTKVLTRYFGLENVGNIVNSSNFKFQDLQNKFIVIMDEFRYSHNFSSDFLKLLGGEPLLITQKYSKDHIILGNLMGLILSNYMFIDKNEDINKALLERLHVVEFLYDVNKNLPNINETLKDEEANIIIFCNKLYFSYFNEKQKRNIRIKQNPQLTPK